MYHIFYTHHSYREVVVDDVVGDTLSNFVHGLRLVPLLVVNADPPPVQHRRLARGQPLHGTLRYSGRILPNIFNTHINYFPDGLSLVAAAPAQTAGQVVAGAERDHEDSWRPHKGSLV